MARGEPDYVDQVPRRQAYEVAHPDVRIEFRGPHWRAVVPRPDGQDIVARLDLRGLLDALDALDDPQPEG